MPDHRDLRLKESLRARITPFTLQRISLTPLTLTSRATLLAATPLPARPRQVVAAIGLQLVDLEV